jgi:hypothetical protein
LKDDEMADAHIRTEASSQDR